MYSCYARVHYRVVYYQCSTFPVSSQVLMLLHTKKIHRNCIGNGMRPTGGTLYIAGMCVLRTSNYYGACYINVCR